MIAPERLKKMSKVAGMVAEDMPKDVKHFEGMPFSGKTLGELHGTLCATIEALAKIVKELVDDQLGNTQDEQKT